MSRVPNYIFIVLFSYTLLILPRVCAFESFQNRRILTLINGTLRNDDLVNLLKGNLFERTLSPRNDSSTELDGKVVEKKELQKNMFTSTVLPTKQRPLGHNGSENIEDASTTTTDVPAQPDFLLIEKMREIEEYEENAKRNGGYNQTISLLVLAICGTWVLLITRTTAV